MSLYDVDVCDLEIGRGRFSSGHLHGCFKLMEFEGKTGRAVIERELNKICPECLMDTLWKSLTSSMKVTGYDRKTKEPATFEVQAWYCCMCDGATLKPLTPYWRL